MTPESKDTCHDKLDNNCDGTVDEKCVCKVGDSQACGSSVGACKAGVQNCKTPREWGPCTGAVGGTKEVCDTIDNDCDGKVDEDFKDVNQPCSIGIGHCKSTGKNVCATSKDKTICNAPKGADPIKETCNGKDDDCDGKIDQDWDLQTDGNHCGTCGNVCGTGNGCQSGKCTWRVLLLENYAVRRVAGVSPENYARLATILGL